MIKAPFTDDQVRRLNKYQHDGKFHPFTCPNRDSEHHRTTKVDHGALVATTEGWVCPDCGYTQDWAFKFMIEEYS